MTDPNSLHLQQLRQLVQPTVEAVAELHQVLNIIHRREINVDQLEEAGLRIRQVLAREELQQVPEIVSAVERDPVHVLVQHDPGGHQQLGESTRLDPLSSVLGEVDP